MNDAGRGRRTGRRRLRTPFLDAAGRRVLRTGVLAWVDQEDQPVRPHDEPRAVVRGPHPDHLLMMGSGAAVGWGVATHQLSLCGAVARAVARLTGRGCELDLVTSPGILAGTILDVVEISELSRYDALIFVVGVNDALRGTPGRFWRASIDELIQRALSATTAATQIFLLGIQPIRSIPTFDRFLGGVAERHATHLNRITASLCAASPRTTYIALPAQSKDSAAEERHRTAAQYTAWAEAISPPIAEHLNARGAAAGA